MIEFKANCFKKALGIKKVTGKFLFAAAKKRKKHQNNEINELEMANVNIGHINHKNGSSKGHIKIMRSTCKY